MLDPYLRNHFVNSRTFSVGGRLSPISIRDQIIRGYMLVDRAHEQKLIQKDDNLPLLIAGAGVSGITAAIRAGFYGVPTLVIDKELQPFAVQKHCASRWICPTQYDWPVDHYGEGKYPFVSHLWGLPLSWHAGPADKLANEWEFQLQTALNNYPQRIDLRCCTALIDPDPQLDSTGEFVWVRTAEATAFLPDGTPTNFVPKPQKPFPVRAVLLAFGFGKERVFVQRPDESKPPARGLSFWQNDPFALPNLGVPNDIAQVLITGSGDGALQDFLRVVIDPGPGGELYARELYNRLAIPADVEHELQSMQDHALRSYAWGAYPRHDHQPLSHLHQGHLRLVDHLLNQGDLGEEIRHKILNSLRDPLPEVRLVFDCDHFSNCYGLNRFLSLLIARVLEEKNGPVIFPGYRVVDLYPQHPHTCQEVAYNPNNRGDPAACYGWRHQVVVQEYRDCSKALDDPTRWGDVEDHFWDANVLILRNGVEQSPDEKLLSAACARQILPYSV
jgi:hypothetical protein